MFKYIELYTIVYIGNLMLPHHTCNFCYKLKPHVTLATCTWECDPSLKSYDLQCRWRPHSLAFTFLHFDRHVYLKVTIMLGWFKMQFRAAFLSDRVASLPEMSQFLRDTDVSKLGKDGESDRNCDEDVVSDGPGQDVHFQLLYSPNFRILTTFQNSNKISEFTSSRSQHSVYIYSLISKKCSLKCFFWHYF